MADLNQRRKKTARELATKFDVSTRTIQRMMAEPREEFIKRAEQRRENILELRSQDLKMREISEQLAIPIGTVGSIIK